MNTNPHAITVLCFGDSNTAGTKPDRSGRYDISQRWPGVLQANLGSDYYVIEEGLGGRTTDLEQSHAPLNHIIIMLGTNDLKTSYDRTAQQVAQALEQYPEYVSSYCARDDAPLPKIWLVSPPYIDPEAPRFEELLIRMLYHHSAISV